MSCSYVASSLSILRLACSGCLLSELKVPFHHWFPIFNWDQTFVRLFCVGASPTDSPVVRTFTAGSLYLYIPWKIINHSLEWCHTRVGFSPHLLLWLQYEWHYPRRRLISYFPGSAEASVSVGIEARSTCSGGLCTFRGSRRWEGAAGHLHILVQRPEPCRTQWSAATLALISQGEGSITRKCLFVFPPTYDNRLESNGSSFASGGHFILNVFVGGGQLISPVSTSGEMGELPC